MTAIISYSARVLPRTLSCLHSKIRNYSYTKVQFLGSESVKKNGNYWTSSIWGKRTVATTSDNTTKVVSNKPTKVDNSSRKRKAEDEPTDVKTVVICGKAPVHPECTSKIGKASVYYEGNDVYDAKLNQTNLEDNNNKYYIIQLLKDNNTDIFSIWLVWGRVGKKGQNSLISCRGLDQAKRIFKQKFLEKTKNNWDDRNNFVKVKGKYDMLKMDYDAENERNSKLLEKKQAKEKQPNIPSKLDERIQDLIKLICNLETMELVVKSMSYDSNKAPLGKLTKEQIIAGYSALKKIEDILENKNGDQEQLVQACNDYYTRIPHDFGMRRPPILRNVFALKKELELLETLGDIEIAVKILSELDSEKLLVNPVDRQYKSLSCDLKPIEQKDKEFLMLQRYLKGTHTHGSYKMELEQVFSCSKENEEKNFTDVGNRMLLFHGSRLSNWMGILSQGLRIAPPEAPHTGFMFGKGIYFADRSSKSANYCHPTRTNNTGMLLLCDVSLGEVEELVKGFNMNMTQLKLKKKKSVKGMGRVIPDPKGTKTTQEGVSVPLGSSIEVTNSSNYTLNYNEYIVYDTRQVKMKYLLKVKFHFK